MEKLCGSIGASFVLLYLVFSAIYHLGSVGKTPSKALACVSVISVGLAIAARGDLVRLFRSVRVRQALAGYVFLLALPYVDAAIGRAQMQESLQDDELHWRGWYGRHGGAVGFLGDRTAGESGKGTKILECLLVVLALGFAGMPWQMSTTTASQKGWRLALFRGAANAGPLGE